MYVRWSVADPDVGIRVPISKTRVKIAGKFCHQILSWFGMPEKTEFREPIQQVLLWNIWYDIFEFCSIEKLS